MWLKIKIFLLICYIYVFVGGEKELMFGVENLFLGWGEILMFWLDNCKIRIKMILWYINWYCRINN